MGYISTTPIMSGLYKHFLMTLLIMTTVLVSTVLFYPWTASQTTTDVQKAIAHSEMLRTLPASSQGIVTKSPKRRSAHPTTLKPSSPKYVVILTYQRCGSSFFGNVFNLNPDAFYSYEPLDSLYSALYGTSTGWNVPSDITNNLDGTLRKVPQVEIDAVGDFLRYLLTGDVDKLPTATLVHRFWTYFSNWHKQTRNYLACLKKHNLVRVNCYGYTTSYCGKRFGSKGPERMDQCRRLILANDTSARVSLEPKFARSFNNYHLCFRSYRQRVDTNCTVMLRRAITEHRLRATKVVRATMNSMGPLLRALPSLRVIHLIRDPRAVALSRNRFDGSARGAFTEKSTGSRVVAEASLYCHHVTSDIRYRRKLEREYPGRIMTVRYEDVVANPEQKFRDIYKLLDEPIPTATLREMNRLASRGRKKNVATKWKKKIKYNEGIAISKYCKELLDQLYKPANNVSHHSTTTPSRIMSRK